MLRIGVNLWTTDSCRRKAGLCAARRLPLMSLVMLLGAFG